MSCNGGLIQLIFFGCEDLTLVGNPEITFFKAVYRRYTNFAVESVKQPFFTAPDFGGSSIFLVSRNGDLASKIYLEITLPYVEPPSGVSFRWIDDIGHHLIKNVKIEIGGQVIDYHYSDWFQVWYLLTISSGKRNGYKRMIGNIPELTAWDDTPKPSLKLYIPLIFWFNRHVNSALPLCALKYHDTKITVEFRKLNECCIMGTDNFDDFETGIPTLGTCSAYIDFIYLDVEERKRFASKAHEYLIEQVSHIAVDITETPVTIRISQMFHPVKELIWFVQDNTFVALPTSDNNYIGNQWSNYTNQIATNSESHTAPAGGLNAVTSAKLLFNGSDRFSIRNGDYYSYLLPFYNHTTIPESCGLNTYSFALNPEELQPSGSANFSKVDIIQLQLAIDGTVTADTAKVKIFSVNYNVLRVMDGMAGLGFAS